MSQQALRRYLADHHGVITLAQARRFGLTDGQIRYRLSTGELVRAGPRVFRLATAPDSWMARARTAALSAQGLISHTSALRIWRIDGSAYHTKLYVSVAEGRRPRTPGVTIRRVAGQHLEGSLVDGVPVTSVARAVVDSAALLRRSDLDAVVDAVVRQGLTTVGDLSETLERLGTRGRQGAGVLKRLLAERDPRSRVPDSRFNRLVGRLLADAGLPEPEYEWEVRDHGRFIGRVDLAYPMEGLVIELDSERWHRDRVSFAADPRRKNQLLLAGYRVLSFTWVDYTARPADLVATVRAALGRGLDVAC